MQRYHPKGQLEGHWVHVKGCPRRVLGQGEREKEKKKRETWGGVRERERKRE